MINKYRISDLKDAFDSIKFPTDASNIVIHSSLFNLGMLSDGSIHDLFEFLINYFNSASRILFPTFTYSFRRKQVYDSLVCQDSIAKEMGILSKIAIKSKRGLRSECPMFSYYIIGQNKEKYISRQSVQCFGKETLFHTLFEEKTIFLGIGINYSNGMTPFMHIEKNAAVPFRYNLRLEGNIIDAISRKKRSATAIHFARNEESYKHIITNSREKLGEAMEKNGISRAIRFNKSKIYALESSSFYDYIFDQLTNNPFCMTEPSNEY